MSGTYTDVVEIVAPSSAVAGETVPVTIKIKNKYSASVNVAAIGVYDSEVRFIDWLTAWIPAGATQSFSGSFVMPTRAVTIHGYSYYYGVDGYWYFDDERTKSVSLTEVYKGTISKKELEYDETRGAIPVSNVPQNKRGLVHVWGRNDMTTTQRMGIWWEVKNPAGMVVETYSTWEAYPYTSPGGTHEFIGGRFDLNKVGTYRIDVALYMNPDSPTIVATYNGTLCTVVAAVPEAEVSQFQIVDYVKV
jgi:hypothetical protein